MENYTSDSDASKKGEAIDSDDPGANEHLHNKWDSDEGAHDNWVQKLPKLKVDEFDMLKDDSDKDIQDEEEPEGPRNKMGPFRNWKQIDKNNPKKSGESSEDDHKDKSEDEEEGSKP